MLVPRTGATLFKRGGHHARNPRRTQLHCSVHWFIGLLVPICLTTAPALAVPPLMPAADMAQVGLQAWWKEGDLLLGVPASKDRPARRPLVDLSPSTLPEEFLGWEPIGEACQDTPRSIAALNGQQVEGAISGTPMHPVVQLVQNGRIMAENALGRPAKVCEIRIVQADAMPGLELIVAWRTGEGEQQIRGFTVFRIPEALGTPAKPNND